VFERILVGADSSPTAARAVRAAAELARSLGAQLNVLMVVPDPRLALAGGAPWGAPVPTELLTPEELPTSLPEHLQAILDEVGCPVTFYAAHGEPAGAIVQVADEIEADLIVVGNRNMRGMRRILGSVPNSVAHNAKCSVMVFDSLTEPGEVDPLAGGGPAGAGSVDPAGASPR
jgi:nucleotide-binding universal stress UspA family protein